MIDGGKRNILGVLVNVIDYDAAVEQIIGAAKAQRAFTVSALAVHGVMTGALDSRHRHRLNQFDLVVPDGQPVRWALNLLHHAGLFERVYGPELTLRVCQRAANEGLAIHLYGSRPEVLDQFEQSLRARFPTLKICSKLPSRFRTVSAAEQHEILAQIRQSDPAIVLVGLGCPRQEVWAYENAPELQRPVLAVGAAFDFHAGLLSQAPPWMQSRGLEWLFRLWTEPRRLWKRYLYLNPLYLLMLAAQKLGLRKFAEDDTELPGEPLRYA